MSARSIEGPQDPGSDAGSLPILPSQQHPLIELHPSPAISPTFPPALDLSTDVAFISSDNVAFYASSAVILARSQNQWNSQLVAPSLQENTPPTTPPTPIRLPEISDILDVVFHTLYDRSCAHLNPSNHTLLSAIDALVKYGLHLHIYIAPSTPLHNLLLDRARTAPLEFFTIAAQHHLDALAVPVSALLLAHDIADIPDACVHRMGPLYLKRLVLLRVHRMDMLKRLVLPPPPGHAPTPRCDRAAQEEVTRAWGLVAATLVLEAGPEVTEITLDVRFRAIGRNVTCSLCQAGLYARVMTLVDAWANVARTI